MSKSEDPEETFKRRCFMRAEAIRRNPQYRQEYEEAFELFGSILQKEKGKWGRVNDSALEEFLDSKLAEELRLRWGLGFLIHPDEEGPWDDYVKMGVRAVEAFPLRRCNFRFIPYETYFDHSSFLKDGRFILTIIDILKPIGQIKKEIEEIVDEYKSISLRKNRKNVRGKAFDTLCWQVWNMHQKEGKSLLSITKIIFPYIKDKDPNVDPDAKALYEKIRAAYKKAVDLIKESTPLPA